jgi:N-acetylmuramoyl-L-alanine amidase
LNKEVFGMLDYKVKQGDCIESIAEKYGLFWETLWNHPKNRPLREKRREANVLFPGDIVFVPEKRIKEESGQTEQRHRFRRKGIPSILRMVLKDEDDEPIANVKYILEIDGEITSGTTDATGKLEQRIKPNARKGKLIVGEESDEYNLDLGYIDPITEISGVQSRLNNLGFDCGKVDGVLGPKTREAIQEFQIEHGLEQTGEIDQQTRNKLKEIYGF